MAFAPMPVQPRSTSARRRPPSQMFAWVVLSSFVLYGSFFPLNWNFELDVGERLAQLWHWSLWEADTVANLLLFLPYGILLADRATQGRPLLDGIMVAAAVAVMAQIGQLWLPDRDPNAFDVLWNGLGAAGGYFAWSSWASGPLGSLGARFQGFWLLLPLSWTAAVTFPWVPTLDPGLIFENIKGVRGPWTWAALLHDAAFGYAAVWCLLRALPASSRAGRFCQQAVGQALMLAGATLGSAAAANNPLSLAELGGATLAWSCLRAPLAKPAVLILVLVSVRVLDALWPMDWQAGINAMEWLPFAGFLQGDALDQLGVLLRLGTQVLALAVIAAEMGWSSRRALIVLPLFELTLEMLQTALPGRQPSLTPAVLALMLIPLVWRLHAARPTGAFPSTAAAPVENNAGGMVVAPDNAVQPTPTTTPTTQGFPHIRWLAALVLAGGLGLEALTHLPGVPYNVRELFLDWPGASTVFVLAMLALVWGGAWCAQRAARSFRAWLAAAWLGLLPAFLLLQIAVSQESLNDVAGANNLRWFLVNERWWGEAGVLLAEMPAPLFDFLESWGRFWALLFPFLALISLALLVVTRQAVLKRPLFWISLAAFAGLAKWIAFDQASTDNLNELFEHDLFAGYGGGLAIYLLVALWCFTAVWLAGNIARWKSRSLHIGGLWAVSTMLGWGLLNLGLTADVGKYGLHFSGVDFLLGPDRTHLLSSAELFLRWIVLHTALLAGMTLALFSLPLRWRLGSTSQEKKLPRFANSL